GSCSPNGGTGTAGTSGAGGAGGDAGPGNSFAPGGGGGGGGYYGGGGGGGACNANLQSGGGGGGSNYPSGLGVISQTGIRSGDGVVIITYTAPEATTTALTSSLNPSALGDSVTFTATVTYNNGGTDTPVGAAGTVEFTADGSTISGCAAVALDGNGQATCTTSTLAIGQHPIVANYSGDSTYASSTSSTVNQVIARTPAITLTPSANPIQVGRTLSLVVDVAATGGGPTPTGQIQVNESGLAISGSCNFAPLVNGTVTCTVDTLSVGNHTLYVNYYTGDTNYVGVGVAASYEQQITATPPTTSTPSTTTPTSSTSEPTIAPAPEPSAESNSSGLPFTGANAGWFALFGVVLVVGGAITAGSVLMVRRRRS
ncbi:MAG: Ig-like domain-containing protein, partial [Acidimicrobiia bacterium]